MSFYSPLRYPGGKNKIAGFIQRICMDNGVSNHYIEPYAGGSAVALSLLISNTVRKITINDKDRSIYAFWHSVISETEELCRLIMDTPVNIGEWNRQKDIQKDKESYTLIELGFSTLFLNRTNRSGIICGGVLGGKEQSGLYKIDCRFNKRDIIDRILRIAKRGNDISVLNMDAVDLLHNLPIDDSSIVYMDPPYFEKGSTLYMNYYELSDHKQISDTILHSPLKWIVSYDNVEEIRNLYKGVPFYEYQFFHTANKSKCGKEILFFCNDLITPSGENPTDYSLLQL